MPNYKVVDADALNADITSIANAIREKSGSSDSLIFPGGFVDAVSTISTGGGTTLSSSSCNIQYTATSTASFTLYYTDATGAAQTITTSAGETISGLSVQVGSYMVLIPQIGTFSSLMASGGVSLVSSTSSIFVYRIKSTSSSTIIFNVAV